MISEQSAGLVIAGIVLGVIFIWWFYYKLWMNYIQYPSKKSKIETLFLNNATKSEIVIQLALNKNNVEYKRAKVIEEKPVSEGFEYTIQYWT